MSEQTIQDGLYSIPVQFDKYVCRSLGATTIKDLVKNKEIRGLTARECNGVNIKKPDVLVLNRNKEIVSDSPEKIQKLADELLNTVVKSSHSTLGTLERLEKGKYDLILAIIWTTNMVGALSSQEHSSSLAA